jgi:GNAT superfamily N-acetyltransferase
MAKNPAVRIASAKITDANILTLIALKAKQFWDYPQAFFTIWEKELTVTEDYLKHNLVFTAIFNNVTAGFYSLVKIDEDRYVGDVFIQRGVWMDHLFVLPEYHNRGIGRKMILHAKKQCRLMKFKMMYVFVDPNARGFYEKVGGKYIYDSSSSVPGRNIPVFTISARIP